MCFIFLSAANKEIIFVNYRMRFTVLAVKFHPTRNTFQYQAFASLLIAESSFAALLSVSFSALLSSCLAILLLFEPHFVHVKIVLLLLLLLF